jgi:hypothetical protein
MGTGLNLGGWAKNYPTRASANNNELRQDSWNGKREMPSAKVEMGEHWAERV